MPAYRAIDGDAERSDGRSTSPSSYQGSRYALPSLVRLCTAEIINADSMQATFHSRKERGRYDRSSQLDQQRYQSGQYEYARREGARCTGAYNGAVVGAGILAMPLALSRMGILLGTIIILWAGLTAGFGLYLQTRCARYLDRGAASFFALSQITYPNAAVIFDAAISIKCFGVGVSYLIIIGDLMPGVVRGFNEDAGGVGFLVDRHFWVTAFM